MDERMEYSLFESDLWWFQRKSRREVHLKFKLAILVESIPNENYPVPFLFISKKYNVKTTHIAFSTFSR